MSSHLRWTRLEVGHAQLGVLVLVALFVKDALLLLAVIPLFLRLPTTPAAFPVTSPD